MNLFVILSVLSLALLMTSAAPQRQHREPVPSDVEDIERDIQEDQAGLEPKNHAKRSYYGGYYGGGFGYPYYGGYYGLYNRGFYGFGHGYPFYGGYGYGHGFGYY